MRLEETTALVTGSAVRVGREIVLELARGGADVVVHYRSSEGPAKELREEVTALGVGCRLPGLLEGVDPIVVADEADDVAADAVSHLDQPGVGPVGQWLIPREVEEVRVATPGDHGDVGGHPG